MSGRLSRIKLIIKDIPPVHGFTPTLFPLEDEDDYLNEIRARSINNDLGHLASLKKITFNLDTFNKHNALNDEIDPNLNLCFNRVPLT